MSLHRCYYRVKIMGKNGKSQSKSRFGTILLRIRRIRRIRKSGKSGIFLQIRGEIQISMVNRTHFNVFLARREGMGGSDIWHGLYYI